MTVPNSPYGLCGRKATLNLVSLQTTATYYMCWHALNRRSGLEHMKRSPCLGNLAALREPLGNQKRILDYRGDNEKFQCAFISFCPGVFN